MNDRVDPLRLITLEPQAGSGVVEQVDDDGRVRVRRRGEVLEMQVSLSCLLVPLAGDRVWWCTDASDDDTHWVVQVLSRPDAAAATVRLPKDTTLQAEGGCLRLRSNELRLDADETHLRTRHATFVFDTAETIGACWQGVVTAMRWTGSTLTSVVDRWTTIAKTRQQFTEGSDVVRAGTFDLRAGGLASIHAEHLLIEAERLVKTRAAQIHMG